MLYNYPSRDISTCLASRRVVFVGDSVTRQLFYSVAHSADESIPSEPEDNDKKHVDYKFTSKDNTEFSFVWDPYLNSTQTNDILRGSVDSVSSTSAIHTPALLVVGSGLWYLRYDGADALRRWEATIEEALERINANGDSVADTVVFLPVENLVPSKLSKERAATMHNTDIDAMNSDLRHRIHPPLEGYLPPPLKVLRTGVGAPRIAFPEAFLEMLDPSQTTDGIHYSEKILKAQTDVLLNLRCNEVLPKKFPLDKTCCRSYPSISTYQFLILAILTSWAFIAKFYSAQLCKQSLANTLAVG